jgi:RND superfamily putative drug exporter
VAIDDEMGADMGRAESLSVPITFVLLLLTFGSVVAALVPLGLALSAVMAAIGIVALLSHVIVMDEAVNNVVLLIGLAVGVDYSLFYLRREREERAAGRSREAALAAAAATSGHAVLVSGITVMIAMAGMFLAGSSIFTALAIGSMIVVAVTLLASVSVLPAVLVGLKGAKRARRESRVWGVILDRVLRRPAVSAAAATAVLVALAIPALSMDTALPTTASVPDDIAASRPTTASSAPSPGTRCRPRWSCATRLRVSYPQTPRSAATAASPATTSRCARTTPRRSGRCGRACGRSTACSRCGSTSRSPPGCRCSCSWSCSACRWTTTCSSSAGSESCGWPAGRPATPCPRASARRPVW